MAPPTEAQADHLRKLRVGAKDCRRLMRLVGDIPQEHHAALTAVARHAGHRLRALAALPTPQLILPFTPTDTAAPPDTDGAEDEVQSPSQVVDAVWDDG